MLDALPLQQALDAMERVGVTKLGGAKSGFSILGFERRGEIFTAGLNVFMDWPAGFRSLCDDLWSQSGLGKWGAEKVYGYMYIWAKKVEGPTGVAIRDELAAHYAGKSFVRSDSVVAALSDVKMQAIGPLARSLGRGEPMVREIAVHLGFVPLQPSVERPSR